MSYPGDSYPGGPDRYERDLRSDDSSARHGAELHKQHFEFTQSMQLIREGQNQKAQTPTPIPKGIPLDAPGPKGWQSISKMLAGGAIFVAVGLIVLLVIVLLVGYGIKVYVVHHQH